MSFFLGKMASITDEIRGYVCRILSFSARCFEPLSCVGAPTSSLAIFLENMLGAAESHEVGDYVDKAQFNVQK
jgi:hypothetical protein